MSETDTADKLSAPQPLFLPSSEGDLFSDSSLSEPPDSQNNAAPLAVTSTRRVESDHAFWVLVPPLPPDYKDYIRLPMPEVMKSEGRDVIPTSFLGESRLNQLRYIYGMMNTRVVHRMDYLETKAKYPKLVQLYETQRREGLLPHFDPSGPMVRPCDRAPKPNRKKTNKSVPTKKAATDSEMDYDEDEELSESDDEGGDSDEYGESSEPAPRRRNRRVVVQSQGFSPKKAVRSSLRQKKWIVEVTSSLDASEEPGDSGDTRSRTLLKLKLRRERPEREVQPGFGIVRSVNELDYDSDRETAPLRAHRNDCEKCKRGPAHKLTQSKKRKRRKRKLESDEEDEEEVIPPLGGWVRCLYCSVVAHWQCLSGTQRDEIFRAIKVVDAAAALAKGESADGLTKRHGLEINQTTEFVCGACNRGGLCIGCKEVAVKVLAKPEQPMPAVLTEGGEPATNSTAPEAALKVDASLPVSEALLPAAEIYSAPAEEQGIEEPATLDKPELAAKMDDSDSKPSTTHTQLLFRCKLCKRACHYEHLYREAGDESSIVEVAMAYHRSGWRCHECLSWQAPLDKIIAWRPSPPDAVEKPLAFDETPDPKSSLPREYLVKWQDRSYRRVEWVPHQWLLYTNAAKLKNFLKGGTSVELLPSNHKDVVAARRAQGPQEDKDIQDVHTSPGRSPRKTEFEESPSEGLLAAAPDAEFRIPSAWKTVDRVLDVTFWKPLPKRKGKRRENMQIIHSEDEEGDDDDARTRAALEEGEEPPYERRETVEQRTKRLRRDITVDDDVGDIIWTYVKWQDLGYEEATWDTPIPQHTPEWDIFKRAFGAFLLARTVKVPKLTAAEAAKRDKRAHNVFDVAVQPSWGQPGTLMPFQLEGVTWLFTNWWNHQPSILADEMGLGKTVQIVTFLGRLVRDQLTFPALVVVPNSTITNWVREFEKWAPGVRVVQYGGEARARDIIHDYELEHPDGTIKYHVLIATYEAVINLRDFSKVFRSVSRWEALVIDEGQRLKSDTSQLFRRLNELHTIHRIIMTGTPMNNNIRELFNLMNFLDPDEWNDLQTLEKQYENLTDDLVAELHARLKPYFLRRTKAEVMKDLPPKHEVIVPVSMTTLQKEVYKSILSQNLDFLGSIQSSIGSRGSLQKKKSLSLNNILMELRKCMQHPYLVDRTIEPLGLSNSEAHRQLVEASAKLRLLKVMLPKLKAKGHRVLLFSQFKIALDIIEDFVEGEGYRYLRLDGDTKQIQRQKDMDEFNKLNSEVFIYLLSTRAGGVGINLWTADTVIVHDPDFNPHQDMQAIARAHRMGQTKPVIVFKLMVKSAAEEKMIQDGKKKLALDHVIVQRMDEEEVEDLQSIFTFGAKALFEEGETHSEIVYTDQDVDTLIERVENQEEEVDSSQQNGMSFGFAKVWEHEKGTLAEVVATVANNNDGASDFWATVLERTRLEDAARKKEEKMGRGVRRTAAKAPPIYVDVLSPENTKRKSKSKESSSSGRDRDSDINYDLSDAASGRTRGSSSPSVVSDDFGFVPKKSHKKKNKPFQSVLPAVAKVKTSDPSQPFAAWRVATTPVALPAKLSPPEASSSAIAQPFPLLASAAASSITSRTGLSNDGYTHGISKKSHDQMETESEEEDDDDDDDDDEGKCRLCHNPGHIPSECPTLSDRKNLMEYKRMLKDPSNREPEFFKIAALRAIEERQKALPKPRKKKKNALPETSNTLKRAAPEGSAGPSNPPKKKAKIVKPVNVPDTERTAKLTKSPRKKNEVLCPICRTSPHHLAKDCLSMRDPVLLDAAITRLQGEGNTQTQDVFTMLLLKNLRQEQSKLVVAVNSQTNDVLNVAGPSKGHSGKSDPFGRNGAAKNPIDPIEISD